MASSSSTSPVGIWSCEKEKEVFEVCSFCHPLSTLAPEASPPAVGAGEVVLKDDHPSAFGVSAGLLNSEVLPEKSDGLFCSVLGLGANKLLVVCWGAGWVVPNAPNDGVLEPLALASALGVSAGLLNSEVLPWKGDGLLCSVLG
jgi:hypothetical protein